MEHLKKYSVTWKLIGVFCVLTLVITIVLLNTSPAVAGN
jgi:hypothetical protein